MKNGFFESMMIVFLLFPFCFFYLKIIFKSLDKMVPRPRPKSALDLESETIEEEISLEAKRRAEMMEKIARFSSKQPERIASLLANWMLNSG